MLQHHPECYGCLEERLPDNTRDQRKRILEILAEPILELQLERSVLVNYMTWRRRRNEDI